MQQLCDDFGNKIQRSKLWKQPGEDVPRPQATHEGLKHLTDSYEGSRPKLEEFSRKKIRKWAMLGVGCFMLGLFGSLSYHLFASPENSTVVREFDRKILHEAVAMRTPALDQVASDITALGSVTIVTLISLIFVTGFVLTKDRIGMVQLIAASAGSGLWMLFLKGVVERPRPEEMYRLVKVSGYSYPSGHSLTAGAFYITFVIMAARHMDHWLKKSVLYGLGSSVVALVALSRVYLGVHYASDVVSGVLFGSAWAFFVATGVSLLGRQSIKEKAKEHKPMTASVA